MKLAWIACAQVLIGTTVLAQCEVWMPPGTPPGVNGPVFAITEWDADGLGPGGTDLIISGNFTIAGGHGVVALARWTGSAWVPVGPVLSAGAVAPVEVNRLVTWDADGPGPAAAALVAGGNFSSAQQPNPTVQRIAVLDTGAAAWVSIGQPINNLVLDLCTWDPDGPGSATPLVIAGGLFTAAVTTAGTTPLNRIAGWDGAAWQPFGTAAGTGLDGEVHGVAAWDPDGPGPEHDHLVACGKFLSAGGVPVQWVARWDGAQWHAFGPPGPPSPPSQVLRVVNWDRDGPGSLSGVLVVGGFFKTLGGAVNSVAFWNGSSWAALDEGLRVGPTATSDPANVYRLSQWDPDGPGPDRADLVVTGSFGIAGSVLLTNVARWDGVTWHAMGIGPVQAYASASWDPDGPGPVRPRVVVGGNFVSAGGQTAEHFAAFGCPSPTCYPDCDGSGTLTIADFGCFQTKFVAGDPYADCNGVAGLTIADFGCFQTQFVAGCP